jgi:hypothetical protein
LAGEFEQYNPASLCEKYVSQLLSGKQRNTRATFLKMVQKDAEEKVY